MPGADLPIPNRVKIALEGEALDSLRDVSVHGCRRVLRRYVA